MKIARSNEKEYNNDLIFLGDVRNKESLRKAMSKVDFVFHAAALKQTFP